MRYSTAILAILIGPALACSAKDTGETSSKKSDAPATSAASAANLPDPCGLVTDDQVSELLWRGMDASQRASLQAKGAKHVITKRVENVEAPAGRTCYFEYKRTAGDTVWGKGDFQLRTLARETFDLFAQSKPSSQKGIEGVGDQAFYLSNAAYGRRGNVGVEVVNFNSKDLEIELLKEAVAKLP